MSAKTHRNVITMAPAPIHWVAMNAIVPWDILGKTVRRISTTVYQFLVKTMAVVLMV
jgi:hypothetical protein